MENWTNHKNSHTLETALAVSERTDQIQNFAVLFQVSPWAGT
jgi:hypothetical protein